MRRGRGSKRSPNIYDVAREARVSVFTVSAVINKSAEVRRILQRRVQAAVKKLNYRPNLLARSLAKRQTHTIGVIVPDIANPFFPLVVRGAADTFEKAGYHVLLCSSDNDPAKEELYLELFLSKQVDGIVLTKAPGPFVPQLRDMVGDLGVPIVLIMRRCRGVKADAVMTDDLQGTFEAVAHLARLGCRRVAFVGGPMNVSSGRARRQGYRKAMNAFSLDYEPNLVVDGDYRLDSGYRAGLSLLPLKPEAAVVTNYLMTVGFMKAARELGLRCPEDFGLVSFDDYPWSGCFQPRLTTVELPKYELGVKSAQCLLDRIKGKVGPALVHRLRPRLIVRESCGFGMRGRAEVMRDVPRAALESGPA